MTYTESARAQLDALQVKDHVRILALETSCDETAVAIVRDGREILTDCIASQVAALCRKSPAVRTSKPATA